MPNTRLRAMLGLSAVILVVLACAAFDTTPTISNVRMTLDATGETPTSTYAFGEDFYVFADLKGLQAGSLIQAIWYAVDAVGLEPNAKINTSEYVYESGIDNVYFQLSTSDGGDWPAGSYRVELYLDGTKVGEQGFTVH